MVQNVLCTSISHLCKEDAVIEQIAEFFLNRQLTEGLDGIDQLAMAVDGQSSLIFTFQHVGGDHPHHPHHTENMIVVLVGHKDMMDVCEGDLHILQNPKDAVAAAVAYARETGTPLFSLGSLYMYVEVTDALEKMGLIEG